MNTSDTSREETSVPAARHDGPGNALDMQLTIAVGDGGALKILGADCRHLPWLAHHNGFPKPLRERLKTALASGLACLADENASAPLADALATLRDAVAGFLSDQEWINAAIHMRVCAEEHAPDAGIGLFATFTAAAREACEQEVRVGGMGWRPFDVLIEENARDLTAVDVGLQAEPITIRVGETIQMALEPARAFLLAGVRLVASGMAIAENADPCIIRAGSSVLALPQIPVRHFAAIGAAGGEVELILIVGTQRREISCGSLRLEPPVLPEAPIALFIDMGSTTTKSLRVHLRGATTSQTNVGSSLQNEIDAAAKSDGAPSWVAMHEPEGTPEYLERLGIAPFNKAALAAGGDDALAAWVAGAIPQFARHAAEHRNATLSHVFWSFPQTGVRDFVRLNVELQRLAGAFVLDRVAILPEHECLRRRFGDVLSRLAGAARARKHKHDKAARKKREYDESWFIVRWFSKKPGSVPELQEWHKRFVKLGADAELREVVIIDAGGFSLDVHAAVRRDGEECQFEQSFSAGGTALTERFREFLAGERGIALTAIDSNEAETIKLRVCSDEANNAHGYASQLRELTAEIYTPHLREVAAWVRERTGAKALPVILTGGGMENGFLRELVRQTLAEHDLACDFITSVELQTLISRDVPADEHGPLRLFMRLTTAFDDRTQPRLEYDVVGGLLEAAREGK